MPFFDIDDNGQQVEVDPNSNTDYYFYVYVSDMFDVLFTEVKDYLGEVEHSGNLISMATAPIDEKLRKRLLLEDFVLALQAEIDELKR